MVSLRKVSSAHLMTRIIPITEEHCTTTIGVNSKTKVAMKKTIFFLMSLCALAFLSCQKEEMGGLSGGTYTYTLIGVADPNEAADLDTKINVGAMKDGVWPIRWATGDVVEVFKASEATLIGKATLADGQNGNTQGKFNLNTANSYTGNVVVAHGTSLDYADGVVSATVSAEQQVAGSDNSAHIGKNGLAYATAAMKGTDAPVDFVLNHKSAYVRLVLKTEEFKEHTLTGATLWCKGAALAGTLSADVKTGAVSVTSSADYVKANVRASSLAAFDAQSVLWFSTLPADLTGKEVWIIVHMTKDIKTVTVPVKITGGNLKAGSVNTITISDLKSSSAPSWYETVESRLLVGGWAYGEANTVMIEKGNSVTVSVKARGDFMKVAEPKSARILHTCNNVWSSNSTNHRITVNGVQAANTLNVQNGPSDKIDLTAPSMNLSITYNDADYGTVAIYDAADNLLWAFTVWGTPAVSSHKFLCGKEVMDRNLGANHNLTNWKAMGGFVQWGRPYGFVGFNSAWQKTSYSLKSDGTLETALANPTSFMLVYDSGKTGVYDPDTYGDWYWSGTNKTDRKNDLWGNTDPTSDGAKSIYDPCPKGWRVISPDVIAELEAATFTVEKLNSNKDVFYKYAVDGGTSLWICAGGVIGYIQKLSENQYFSKNRDIAAVYWSNCPDPTDSYKARAWKLNHAAYALNQVNLDYFNVNMNVRANGGSVRCMKDTENR